LFQFQIGRLTQIMHQENIFRRNGGVGLQLIDPMPVRALFGQDGVGGGADGGIEAAGLPAEFPGKKLVHGPIYINRRIIGTGGAAPKRPPFRRTAPRPRWWRAGRSGSSRPPGRNCARWFWPAAGANPRPWWRRRWRAFP